MNDRDLEPEKCVETGPFIDHASNKRRIIVLLLAYSAVLGVLSCFLPEEDSPVDLAVGLPLLILGIMWCSVDAAERNHRTGILIRFALVLLFLVGFPIYLVQTRGIGAFKALAVHNVAGWSHVDVLASCVFCNRIRLQRRWPMNTSWLTFSRDFDCITQRGAVARPVSN